MSDIIPLAIAFGVVIAALVAGIILSAQEAERTKPVKLPPAQSPQVAIDNLGRLSAQQIAHVLADEEIRGYRGDPTACPIAKYLDKHFGGEWIAGASGANTMDGDQRVVFPFSVSVFVAEFDDGGYRQLRA